MKRFLCFFIGLLFLVSLSYRAFGEQEQPKNIDSLKNSDWWGKVQANLRKSEYEASWQEKCLIPGGAAGYHITNRSQDLRLYFYPDNIKIIRRTEQNPSWIWEYKTREIGREKPVPLSPSPVSSVKGNTLEFDRKILIERYENTENGIKQYFFIKERVEGSGPLILTASIGGNLSPVPKPDQRSLVFSHQNNSVLEYQCQNVKDAADRTIPSRVYMTNNLMCIEIHDAGASYPIAIKGTIIGMSTGPGWYAESNQANAGFGGSAASAGDLNGDGYDDIVVGAEDYDNGENEEGAVFVWFGSANGLAITGNPGNADWMAEGNQANMFFGCSIGTAGDVNQDGLDELIIGARGYTNGENMEGAVFIYQGFVFGLWNEPQWKTEGNKEYAVLGSSVGTAGDVNGDGYDDIIVGAPGYNNGQVKQGAAFVYSGSSASLISGLTLSWTAEGDRAEMMFGNSLGTAGDTNGDGYDDIIIGAFTYSDIESNEGAAFVWFGGPSGLGDPGTPENADWKDESDKAETLYGSSVATAGDVNGDGYADIIIGAPWYTDEQTKEGAVYVYYGSSEGPSPYYANWITTGNNDLAEYGASVATAGDLNRDGYDEVIIGAPGFSTGGVCFLYYGGPVHLSTGRDWISGSFTASSRFGTCVASAGDVNGDGAMDLIVGAPEYSHPETGEGAVYLYYGAPGDWIAEGNKDYASFGSSVSSAGDINGDGYIDVIVGAPLYDNGQYSEGRAFLYQGSKTGLHQDPDWTAESNLENMYFADAVASAGDVNKDGFADILIAAYNGTHGENQEGVVYLWYGSSSGLGDSGTPANADWKAESNQNFAHFGKSLGCAGDVNRDGYHDIIIGAPNYSNSENSEGAAFVWYGSTTGLGDNGTPGNADWSYESNTDSAFLGESSGAAGDVNGDLYSDIIVGAPGTSKGNVYVFHGSSGGPSLTPDWSVEGGSFTSGFGSSVGTVGDVNGDGYFDIIIGAYMVSGGAAYVFLGSDTGLGTTADWQAGGAQQDSQFGKWAGTAGDVNGDGYSDVIIGAPQYKINNKQEGAAFVWFGSRDGLGEIGGPSNADWMLNVRQNYTSFGTSACTAGDVNGDGFSDIIVGAPGYMSGQQSEGAAFCFYGSGRGPARNFSWKKEGVQPDDNFSISVNSAGDVNGDGFADVIVGADLYDNGETDEGGVFVFYGSENGPGAAADWMAQSNQASCLFGHSAGTAGDVNGDGYDEVIIGAPSCNNGNAGEGAAFVWFGSATGLGDSGAPANADWMAESNYIDASFGVSVGTAGDVNADGYADIIVGADGYGNGEAEEGAAFVWHGSASGLGSSGTPANADWMGESNFAHAAYGLSVATAGDVNADGFSDVIVGAEKYYSWFMELEEGAAFVYYGSSWGLSSTPGWMAEGNQATAFLGHSVSTAGDVNGDGYSDILVAAPHYQTGGGPQGMVFAWYGSAAGLGEKGSTVNADWAPDLKDLYGGYFGNSAACAGDVNGDGFADVIIGQEQYTGILFRNGRASVYLGSAKGLKKTPEWMAVGAKANERYGCSVAGAGDVNGDGFADIIVGAYTANPGTAQLYYGNQNAGFTFLPRQLRTNGATPISQLGLSDNPNQIKLSLNAPNLNPYGRCWVQMEWEVLPLSFLLKGSYISQGGNILEITPTIPVTLVENVGGLLPGPAYHWRMRLKYDPNRSPFHRYSRWITIPWNGVQEARFRTGASPKIISIEELKLYLLGKITFSAEKLTVADANGDGKVDIADLVYLVINGP